MSSRSRGPENDIIQESELSRPINVVDQLFGGDQEKVLLAKVRSSIPAALRQLPSRQFNTLHLIQDCRGPGVQALNGNKFLVVFVHAPAAPKTGNRSTAQGDWWFLKNRLVDPAVWPLSPVSNTTKKSAFCVW
jgi:hypothetical protein